MTSRSENLITITRNAVNFKWSRSAMLLPLLIAALLLPAARAEARQDTLALAMRGFRLPSVQVPRTPAVELPRFRGAEWNIGEGNRFPIGVAGAAASQYRKNNEDDIAPVIIVIVGVGVCLAWAFRSNAVAPADSDRSPSGAAAKREPTKSPPSRSGWVSPTIRRRENE